MGARLFRFRRAWQGATHGGIVRKGLGWSWKRRLPRLKRLRQMKSPQLDAFIKDLRKKRVIEKAKCLKWQSRLFTVPKKDSAEGRLILDLSVLNDFINCPSFKMLTLKEAKLVIPSGFWAVSIDLADGYWHIPIAPRKRPYLGFSYRGVDWQFRALPFGLNIGPRAFTKLISHVVRVMGEQGIFVLPYLDDLLILSPTKELCLQHKDLAIQILNNLGFLINYKKSILLPSQQFHWLGIDWDLINHTAQVSQDKIQVLQMSLKSIIQARLAQKKLIMALQGQVNYIGACDPIIKLLMSTTRKILRGCRWKSPTDLIEIPIHLRLQLCKWLGIQTIPQPLGYQTPVITIQTDASLKGWGFQIGQKRFHGDFNLSKHLSINVLELVTIFLALLMVSRREMVIQVLCDNTSAVSALRKGSSPHYYLSSVTELIWKRAAKMGWNLVISHIKGSYNVLADQLSRKTTISSEWSIPQEVFQKILHINPKLEVDLFATHLNNKLPTFVSPCPDQGIAIDALSIPWDKWKHLYMFPPRPLIAKALAKLVQTQFLSAILVTPEAPTRPWFLALKLRMIPSTLMTIHLHQIVVSKQVTASLPTTLRVWNISKKHMTKDFQTALML